MQLNNSTGINHSENKNTTKSETAQNKTNEVSKENKKKKEEPEEIQTCKLDLGDDFPKTHDTLDENEDGASTNVLGNNKTNSTNALGYVGLKNLSISKVPWFVSSCDQVIQIYGERLTNMRDFTQREPSFFTLSMYMVNMFSQRDSNALVESLDLQFIKDVPKEIPGAKGCLKFLDSQHMKYVPLCLSNDNNLKDLQSAFTRLLRCRMGDNLNDGDPGKIIRQKGNCLGAKIEIPRKLGMTASGVYSPELAKENMRKILFNTLELNSVNQLKLTIRMELKKKMNGRGLFQEECQELKYFLFKTILIYFSNFS